MAVIICKIIKTLDANYIKTIKPITESHIEYIFGQVPKWPNGAGCKPAAETLRRFESFPAHLRGNSSVGRASAFQAVGRGFESRFPLFRHRFESAHVAQLVEHVLGKDGVTSSSLVVGLANKLNN